MALPPSVYLEKLTQALAQAEIGQQAVEVHGALIGLLSGGLTASKAWHKPMAELMNDGQPLSNELLSLIEELYQDALNRLTDVEFGFQPLLPEEEETLLRRVEALSLWSQSFLTGLALQQTQLNKASKDVREVIQDLSEIARVELEVTEDEESEAAYIEILEFVRMAAILCFSEFNPSLEAEKPTATLH